MTLLYRFRDIDEAQIPARDFRITVTLPCRNRLEHVQRAAPAWLAQVLPEPLAAEYRVLVVDYGCPQGTYDWVKSQRHPRLDAIKVADTGDKYHYTHARNVGLRVCRDGFVVACDADMVAHWNEVIHASWTLALQQRVDCLRVRWHGTPIPFPMFMRREAWRTLRGFCEDMVGWGHEDMHFYDRVRKAPNYGVANFPGPVISTLPLPKTYRHAERVGTANINREIDREIRENKRQLNPDGFGRCRYRYFVGATGEEFDGRLTGEPLIAQDSICER